MRNKFRHFPILFLLSSSPRRNDAFIHTRTNFIPKVSRHCDPTSNGESGNTCDPIFFPVGKSDFPSIVKSKQFFVDNSNYIRKFEKIGEQIIFTRPPRWGKSLLLSMLQSYYDINTTKEEFDELFGGLEIYKQVTLEAREFYVLPIDLTVSVVGDLRSIQQAMFNEINGQLKNFTERYHIVGAEIIFGDALASLVNVVNSLRNQRPGAKLYVMIDEYDRFANKLMFENLDHYDKIIVGSTSEDPASSPLQAFLETVKKIKTARTLIMGISSIVLADASGANIFTSVSNRKALGSAVGFKEQDLVRGLEHISLSPSQRKSALELMRKLFNGYRFHGTPDDAPLFCSQQCLHFLAALADGCILFLLKDDYWRNVDVPKLLVHISDSNCRISKNVFSVLTRSSITRRDIFHLVSNYSIPVLEGSLNTEYRLNDLINPVMNIRKFDPQVCIDRSRAFMFSHGMLTLAPRRSNLSESEVELVIPNSLARDSYFTELDSMVELRSFDIGLVFDAPTAPTIQVFLQSIVNQTETLHSDDFLEDVLQVELESFLKVLVLRNPHYRIICEGSVESRNYLDILLVDTVNDIAVVLELARIRYKYILDLLPPNESTSATRFNVAKLRAAVECKYEKDLLNLQWKNYSNVKQSVEELLSQKAIQCQTYVNKIRECGFHEKVQLIVSSKTTIYSFAVVQVGERIVVRNCDLKKQQ
mmetsp:Transcript_1214/g.1996  ORF Transcript_1214/g.1996 Transcript_1214/m.1996 type:complete len:702 (+) Transcript_1214:34-2139(+)